MKKNTILLLIAFLPFCSEAQKTIVCSFEKLFAATPGTDMPSAVTQLQAYNQITLINQTSAKLKPYQNKGGDSILHETVTYRIDSSECLKGKKSTVKFEFANGKLFKAFIETTYGTNEFNELMANFDFLHNEIKKQWKFEHGISVGGGTSAEGSGYVFNKTTGKKAKLDMCMLQYIKNNSSNPNNINYTLEILWVNLNNTRMESSAF
jgi:hypothetical protein